MMYLLKIPPIGGIPISEGLACVKMPCIYIPPENRFKYVWKMLIPNKVSNWTPLCAEKLHAACVYHILHLNCTEFWADYFLCCHNANKPWFLTGELVIQGLAWLCSFKQLRFPVYARETIVLESNVYCYFRKMGHSGWWVHTCLQVTTTLPFPVVQVGGAEEMGGIFPGAKRSWQVENCWSRISTCPCIWHNATRLCRSIWKNTTHFFFLFFSFIYG